MLRPGLLLLPILLLGGEAAPTGDEQLVLDLINLHRADRQHGEFAIAKVVNQKLVPVTPHEWGWAAATFHVPSMAQPLPPLVFNPKLLLAARALLAEGAKPPAEKPFDALPATRKAGYEADAAMAMVGLDAASLNEAYGKAVLNRWGTLTQGDKSYPRFALRESLKPAWREAGIAVSKGKNGTFSLVVVLGPGGAKRLLGGVAYADANRNQVYDPGEGKAGVVITCGAATTTTGPAGTWWLGLDDAAAELALSADGFSTTRPLEAKATSQVFSWRLPNPADVAMADRLLAAVEQAGADPVKTRNAQVALLAGTLMAALDDARRARVDALIGMLRDELAENRAELQSALSGDPAAFRKRVVAMRSAWPAALAPWFKEAEGLATLKQQLDKILAAPVGGRAKAAPAVQKLLDKAMLGSADPAFLAQYRSWSAQLDEAVAEEADDAGKAKK